MSDHRDLRSSVGGRDKPRRLVIRSVNWLGDAVMSTPALIRLREALPEAHITLLTQEKLADLWQGHSAVDAVLRFGVEDGAWCVARKIRGGGFDTALLLPNSPRSALESFLARIPRRIGGSWPWRNWLLTEVVPQRSGSVRMRKLSRSQVEARIRGEAPPSPPLDAGAHHIHHYLHLAAALGASTESLAPRLHVAAAEEAGVREKFGLMPSVRWIGINAGAEYGPAKRWPCDRFIAAAHGLSARTRCRFVILGGIGDMPLAAEFASAVSDSINLAGRTTLRELCAVMKVCSVVLTNDTGPMHLAAALGTPVVVPFGSTAPELTGPGLPGDPRHQCLRAGVPCSPCFLRECPIDFRCMTGISVQRVVEAALERLESDR